VAAGIANQCPSWAKRFAQVVRQTRRAVDALLTRARPDPVSEFGNLIERFENLTLGIAPHVGEFVSWPGHEHGQEPVVRGKREHDSPTAKIELECAARCAAPIREVPAGKSLRLFGNWCLHLLSHNRVPPIGPDDETRSLGRVRATHAHDTPVIEDELVNREALAAADARLNRSLDEHAVECQTSWAESDGNPVHSSQ
jgi:hypothetical protein